MYLHTSFYLPTIKDRFGGGKIIQLRAMFFNSKFANKINFIPTINKRGVMANMISRKL